MHFSLPRLSSCALLVTLLMGMGNLFAEQDGIHFFEKNIRPMLINECSKCHGAEKQKGNLRLDQPVFLAKGGDSGKLFIARKPNESLIIKAVQREIAELEMPPKKHLSQDKIDLLKTWIQTGATLPKFDEALLTGQDTLAGDLETVKQHWSFQSVQKPQIKTTKSGFSANNPIDHFIHQKLIENKLNASPQADTVLLLRRLYLDMIGLPPSEKDIEEFLKEPFHIAYPQTVEKLLHSKHYGEKWGKHWLNLVRYAESTGKDENHGLPHARQYRKYVIDAFNEDLPFDQFIVQQLASDLFPEGRKEEEVLKQIPATAFNMFGPKNIAERDLQQLCMDTVDEQLDNVSMTFLGLTMSCARCHDHKFDPISTKEYYALAGIFKSTQTMDAWTPTAIKQHHSVSLLPQKDQAHNQTFHEKLKPLQAEYQKLKRNQSEKAKQRKKEIEEEVKKIEINMIPEPRSYALADFPATSTEQPELTLQNCKVHVRGSYQNQKGEPIQRSPPYIFKHLYKVETVPSNQSGRYQLAQWIAHPQNPLTARVIVNRIWTWHFGTGLVRTSSNFGTTGEAPSHPELLDYLASYFIEHNWSIKQLHRHILASATYQQACRQDSEAEKIDPARRYLWSFPEQRLDAEIIRDRILSVSGELNLNPTPTPPLNALGKRPNQPGFDNFRERSVYLSVVRNRIHPMFRIFNFTTASMPIPQRENSSLSTQALFMNNSPFIIQQAQKTAERLMKLPSEKRAKKAFMWIYNRPAKENELAITQQYLQAFQNKTKNEHKSWTYLVQSMFRTHEFLNIN